jgi:hypothetical protein
MTAAWIRPAKASGWRSWRVLALGKVIVAGAYFKAVKIKRLYIVEDERRTLCWQDEHGKWQLGDTNSAIAFAQGFVSSPGAADGQTHGPHPELARRTIYYDWFTHGEDSASYETPCIIEAVIIEAWRRWNAGWYRDQPAGDIELPKPGNWTINRDGTGITRTGDA